MISKNYPNIEKDISKNLYHIKEIYHSNLSPDIVIRNFCILVNNTRYKAFIVFIDGMSDNLLINNFILKPLMLRNDSNTFDINNENFQNKKVTNFDISTYVYDCLLPQNAVDKATSFEKVLSSINIGNCILFVDSIEYAFNLDVKGFKQREINSPKNEIIVRGSQESFVENLRTNTSILRRLINNENLIIETLSDGKLTKTQVAISYLSNITNKNLITEIKRRINNLKIDYLTSSGQLEQLIQDNPNSIYPQIISTERPDKAINFLLDGRVCIIVNGSPYALIVPGIFVDFLSSPEDVNIKYR